jgi:hypothetical protein
VILAWCRSIPSNPVPCKYCSKIDSKSSGRCLHVALYIRLPYILKTFEVKEEIERGVKVHNWPHIILKNNARHRIKTIY